MTGVKKIEFAPGCFDHLEFDSQEELDALVKQIQDMFANMSEEELLAQSRPLDMDELIEEDPEFAQAIMDRLSEDESPRKLQ